ncbi:MAG TPA: amino acid adenylation domain-containing protein, partial [Thermoanaerobaculia bacterium]|nr:amino acid adenylation domain-containing protein [Thermoanaerobaculia bacterium]
DPTYPAERLAVILEDARASVVVTHRGMAERLPGSVAVIVDLDTLEPAGGAAVLDPDLDLDNLAYTIFTSGSTGRPKGVQIAHRTIVHLAETAGRLLSHEGQEVWTMFHSYAFDLSVWEMWVCLAHGGTLVVVPVDVARDPVALHDLLAREGVTVLHQTPAALRQLVQVWEEGVRDPAELRLRRVACGGEALPGTLVEKLFTIFGPDLQVWNLYGPTEVTVWGTAHPVGTADLRRAAIPLGRPLPDARVYVLDPGGNPAPYGVAGEICIGGFGPTRGYASQPALTAEKVVPDPFSPFSDLPGARMYRTGDLGRRRADGHLEFVGRIDFQVKVRGFRVELREIEVALASHPRVRQAVVLLRGTSLVACVAAEGVGAADLREQVGRSLPAYMVPSAFVILPALPLTPNGKVDRHALARIEPAGAEAPATDLQGPRTPAEEIVADAWREVLGIERIDVHQSFFDAGGHSLLATQVVSRLRVAFGVEVPLRALFEAPTIAGLAQAVEALGREGEGITAPPLRRGTRPDPLPLSFAQEWMWLIDQLDPEQSAFGVPLAVRLRGALDTGALRRALAEVVRRHEVLRTTFPVVDGHPVQRIAAEVDVPLPLEDLSSAPDPEAAADRRIDEGLLQPLDLVHGPLLRALLLRLGAEEHVLVLSLHHILFDGWSGGVLVREVATLYRAFAAGSGSPLTELPVQYADYSLWQRGWLEGGALAPLLAWWKERLAGAP